MELQEAKSLVSQLIYDYNAKHLDNKKFLNKELYYYYVGAFSYCHELLEKPLKEALYNDLDKSTYKPTHKYN